PEAERRGAGAIANPRRRDPPGGPLEPLPGRERPPLPADTPGASVHLPQPEDPIQGLVVPAGLLTVEDDLARESPPPQPEPQGRGRLVQEFVSPPIDPPDAPPPPREFPLVVAVDHPVVRQGPRPDFEARPDGF